MSELYCLDEEILLFLGGHEVLCNCDAIVNISKLRNKVSYFLMFPLSGSSYVRDRVIVRLQLVPLLNR